MPHTELIEERIRFLEIDNGVIRELEQARRFIEPEMDGMLEQFYSRILEDPLIKGVFADEKSIERARGAQKKHWLTTLFGGKFNNAYFDQAERIGRAHARVGLTPDRYIGGYCYMLVSFIKRISTAAAEEGRDPSPTIQALCKAVLLDVDLVMQCYLEAKNELMVDLLGRATEFSDDLVELNRELGLAAAEAQSDSLMDIANRIDERVRRLKFRDRLYITQDQERTGVLARLKALVSRR